MNLKGKIIASLVLLSALSSTCELFAWEMKKAPIMTKWAELVSPENALPEYPRPQLVRSEWMNLNGLWEFEGTEGINKRISADEWKGVDNSIFKDVKSGEKLSGEILVPYPVESALSGMMKHFEYMKYRREFEVPSKWANQDVQLNFGAVDFMCDVYINGKLVGSHKGGYDSFSFNITKFLKSGKNEIIVSAYDPTDNGTQPVGKQRIEPEGYWYTPCSGIWQTVWLEPISPKGCISQLKLIPSVKDSLLKVTVKTDDDSQKVELIALDGKKVVSSAKGDANKEILLPVPNAKLWSPDSPFLYDLKIKLVKDDKTIDNVESYFGMRDIAVKTINGVVRPTLNGEFLFHLGTLDQGYWPDGNLTAPTDEALKSDIENHKKLGFNMIRKHIKVEPARWFYWCDKLGVLVWQDMPNSHTHSVIIKEGKKEVKKVSYRPNEEQRKEFEGYLKEMIDEHISHPSVVCWILFNEGWSIYERKYIKPLADWVKAYDPSRLVNDSTGLPNEHVAGDVYDIHIYQGPSSSVIPDGTFSALGEFGGVGLNVKGHNWFDRGGWAYGDMNASNAELTKNYLDKQKELFGLMLYPGLCASMYTQISDVEGETNGIYTYDRKVLKIDEKLMKEAHDRITKTSKALPLLTDADSPLSFAKKSKLVSIKKASEAQFAFLKSENGKDALITSATTTCKFNMPKAENASAGIVMRAGKNGGYMLGIKSDGAMFIKSFGDVSDKVEVEKKIDVKGKIDLKAQAFGSLLYLDINGNKLVAYGAYEAYGKFGVFAQNERVDFADFKINNDVKRFRANGFQVKFIVPREKGKNVWRAILDCNAKTVGEIYWDFEKGLADENGVSFRNVAYPDKYLVANEKGEVYLETYQDTPEFKKNATWYIRKGLDDESKVSFESTTPNVFLSYPAWNLTNLEIKTNGAKKEATFDVIK